VSAARSTARSGTGGTSAAKASADAAARILAEPRWVRLELALTASPERTYVAWSDPERLRRWFPHEIQGSLAPGTRSTLVWPHKSTWWEVEEAEPSRRFVFRWPWLADDSYRTMVTVTIAPEGYGTRLTLEDGPFDLTVPGVLDAWAEANAGWGEALAFLKGFLDSSVDLRPR
jgi:uncharacterized protein YndB with AHSA1/START domain